MQEDFRNNKNKTNIENKKRIILKSGFKNLHKQKQ